MSGTVYPREASRPTTSVAELTLLAAMRRGLPEGWVAWHSLRLRVGAKWEGEGDFVVAVPGRGFFVLEAKGGRLELRDGRWFQNNKSMPKAPRDQAQAFVRQVAAELRRAGVTFPAFGVACAFPDMDFSEGPETGDLRGTVIGRRDLPWLPDVLPALVERVLPEPAPCNDDWIAALHRLWGETWVPHVRLRDRIADAELRAVALNEQQLAILDIAGDTSRAVVDGPAGSGKTILARELCLRRARQRRSVIYLCFTDALATTVGGSFPSPEASHIHATSLRRFALELSGASPPDDAAGWHEALHRALATVRSRPRPELVVVDEAQDLEPEDWRLVEALAEGADLWIFRDPAQQFWTERMLPAHLGDKAAALRLFKQQRNPPAIAALASRYRPAPSGGALPAGTTDDELRVLVYPPGAQDTTLELELDRLVAAGVRPAEIAVVSLAGQVRSVIARADRLGAHRLVRADAPDADAHVVADTFLRFKGLERPFILVVDLDRVQGEGYSTRMHIALTRATAGCIVLATPEAFANDLRLDLTPKGAPAPTGDVAPGRTGA